MCALSLAWLPRLEEKVDALEDFADALHRARIAEMERRDAEGYAKQPATAEEIAESEAWQSIQAWGDDWSEAPSVG